MADRVRIDAGDDVKWLFAAFALCACLEASNRPALDARQLASGDVVAVQTAIEVGNRAYLAALEGRDARRFAALFADDAISLPPTGEPIRGRTNIENAMASSFQRVTFLDGSTHTLELQLLPDSAIEIGTYRYVVLIDGVAEELRGRYVTTWRLIAGAWKIAVDASQPQPTPPEAPMQTPSPQR